MGGLRVAIAQINLKVGDIEGNRQRVAVTARRARQELEADLVVFPELTLTGYPPEDLLLRPELDERVERALSSLAEESREIAMVLGYPAIREGRRLNAAGLLWQGSLQVEYHKALLPNYSVFDEKRYFEPGHAAAVASVAGVAVGITICEDIWYPDPAARARVAGAQLLINLNASPFHRGKPVEREQMVAKRARENAMPVIYVNLVGGQDELVFDGGSFVTDAAGRVTQRSPWFAESLDLVLLESAPGGAPRPQDGHREALPDERAAIYQALVCGVRDYVRKNGFQGALLGLSGGIDSALTLAIAVDALGADQVEAVSMPSRYTADISNLDAAEQARIMGVAYRAIAIESVFQGFLDLLAEAFAGQPQDATEENIQSRCRGVLLMALSNKSGRILLTTGNKSEMSVGYATLYGDMAGGFAPLKDIPKLLVYELARYRNGIGAVIPQRVISRPPSAELRPDQQDSDSLPPYDILDPILQRYIEQDLSIERIVADGFDAALVRRVTRMVDRNEYKRRQAPPGVRITQRAFGRDRRYPLTNGF
jgi:NAD+ synthase (glutamine-hydrolysing)